MEIDAQGFATWKFKWINAMLVVIEGKELRVALYLLQRCNAGDKQINPSMKNMAHMMNCDVKSVERAAARLVEMGVVRRWRFRRKDSYNYEFLNDWLLMASDIEQRLRDEWQGKRLE